MSRFAVLLAAIATLAVVACSRAPDAPDTAEAAEAAASTEVAVAGAASQDIDNPAQPPPPPPHNVRAVQEGISIRITWTHVEGATHYEIHAGDCAGTGSCRTLDWDVTGAEYTHTPESLRPPARLRVIDRTHDSLTVEWQHVSHSSELFYSVTACNNSTCSQHASTSIRNPIQIDYYQVHQRSQEGGYKLIDSKPIRSPHVDRGLRPNTTYFYTIQTCSYSSGCSTESHESGGLTESDGPVDAPPIPQVRGHKYDVSFGTDDAGVSWRVVDGATYYEVYQDSQFDQEISAPRTEYRDSNPNTSWGAFSTTSYSVRACNKAGCSPHSKTVTIH